MLRILGFKQLGLSCRLGIRAGREVFTTPISRYSTKRPQKPIDLQKGPERDQPSQQRKQLNQDAVGKAFGITPKKQTPVSGFMNWKTAAALLATGVGLFMFYKVDQNRGKLQSWQEAKKSLSKPLVGGPFNLINQDGKPFTERNLLGQFSLIYFGFTLCPDICPDELDKMAEVLDVVNKNKKQIYPIFITCDPARDTPKALKDYLAEFHSDIIGLTGSKEDIEKACKAYSVYVSSPSTTDESEDYLVDHSTFFYLMDPEGKFLDMFGRHDSAETITMNIKRHVTAWKPREKSLLGALLKDK